MNEIEKYNRDKATVISIIKYILIAAIICLLLFLATKIVAVMVPFLIGFLLAKTAHAIGNPLGKRFVKASDSQKFKKIKKTELAIYYILLVIIGLIAFASIVGLISQGASGITSLRELAGQITTTGINLDFLYNFSTDKGGFLNQDMILLIYDRVADLQTQFIDAIPTILGKTVSSIWSFIGNIPYGIFVVICVILSGHYFISDGPTVLKMYMKSVPNKSFRVKSINLLNDLSVTLFRALGGYLLLLIITMIESWVAFTAAGVHYALVLALITAILDFMPVLGISATMIPVMIYCAIHENYTGIIILIIFMALMTVIRRFIEPPILGKSLKLHPLIMLIAMAGGVYIWGPIGFLMGPVVFIIIIQTCKVFGLDKKIKVFFSLILEKFMKPAE
ncbi:MAG: AI-2E family transporter [Saccharofermentans sp.]|nr:AI-2E family transporter [Saccharofermentans sp.]